MHLHEPLRSNLRPTALGLISILVVGCGAPTQEASDVAHLFSGDSVPLQEKLSNLCSNLEERSEAPTIRGLDLDLDGCADAGLAALDYNSLSAFKFLGIEGDLPDKDQATIIRKTVRSQVWLNRTLLGLASAISKKLTNTSNQPGSIATPDSGKQISGLVKTELEQVEPFYFDKDAMELSALLRLRATDGVEVDNEFRIAGKLIDDAFALTVESTQDRSLEESLIKSLSAVILIVPHASDVYLDMYVDLQVHNVGLEGLFKEVISGLLADNLKKMSDTMLAL